MTERVYIGVAWPYANGGLHLGHVAGSLLPPDISKRYHKLRGRDVLMVSGSDCHGTPILLKAEAEGITPGQLVERYHQDHKRALERLAIDFDLFTTTTTKNHVETVHEIFRALDSEGLLSTETQQAPYDAVLKRFLPDRYVEGTCPHCNFPEARGDQCDNCGKTLEPQELVSPRNKTHPENPIEFRDTEHRFLRLDLLQEELTQWIDSRKSQWRTNVVNFTENWLKEGLRPRPITRDLDWGIPIPGQEGTGKCIYVWFEAVCGYYSAAKEWASTHGEELPFWYDPSTRGYYYLGKDNIPFHTIIWPAILIGYNRWRGKQGLPLLNLPYDVPANEFLNLDGKQFSKSRGVSIQVHDVLDVVPQDSVRYYLAVNLPEGKDSDWTWSDFLAKNNDELVGIVGNLAHRVLSFAAKHLDGVPDGAKRPIQAQVDALLAAAHPAITDHLEQVQLKKGLRRIVELAGDGNQLMQQTAPWKLLKEDPEAAKGALYDLLRLVRALGIYLTPYVPEGAAKILQALPGQGRRWDDALAPLVPGEAIEQPEAAFRKLDQADLPMPADASAPEAKPQAPKTEAPAKTSGEEATGLISIDQFGAVELRIGQIISVENHPKADRLYVLRIEAGALGVRQIVAGLKAYYRPEELAGKRVAFCANLQPVKLRGVESQGMILAADDGERVSVLHPGGDVTLGARIR